jgi:hypothetical protein
MSEVKQEGDFKIKSKKKSPKKLSGEKNQPVKVNLKEPLIDINEEPTKVVIPKENANKEQETTEVASDQQTGDIQEVVEEVPQQQDAVSDKEQVLEEITEEEEENKPEKTIVEDNTENNKPVNKALPENIEKLVSFMEETGGTVEDYVRLNADYSNVDDKALLKEYYKKTKPYLESEDISIMLEDYDYDEDLDEERDIRKKKIAFKEEVAKARNFLEETKSKYYDEIKLRPGVTQEQQKAMDFFNRYNEDQKVAQTQHKEFVSKTNNYFTENFKGFDFKVSDKKYRYGVQDPGKLAKEQSNINNFVGKFLDNKGNVSDPEGYHKAIFMASNADKIINHFYEQGKSDATKEIIGKSKNPSSQARSATPKPFINGLKVKSINGVDSSKLTIKKKKF